MSENNTSRVGNLIRNFRIAAELTQKQLAERCGLNESTIRNYELGNRYPDQENLFKISKSLNVSYFSLADPDIANIYSALHALFNIEWAYGLRPTFKNGEVKLIFNERLDATGSRPKEDLDAFQTIVENWAKMRDKVESGELTESEYWFKEITFPMQVANSDGSYNVQIEENDTVPFQLNEESFIDDIEAGNENAKSSLQDVISEAKSPKRKRKPKNS